MVSPGFGWGGSRRSGELRATPLLARPSAGLTATLRFRPWRGRAARKRLGPSGTRRSRRGRRRLVPLLGSRAAIRRTRRPTSRRTGRRTRSCRSRGTPSAARSGCACAAVAKDRQPPTAGSRTSTAAAATTGLVATGAAAETFAVSTAANRTGRAKSFMVSPGFGWVDVSAARGSGARHPSLPGPRRALPTGRRFPREPADPARRPPSARTQPHLCTAALPTAPPPGNHPTAGKPTPAPSKAPRRDPAIAPTYRSPP
jgi:hypothetical protein